MGKEERRMNLKFTPDYLDKLEKFRRKHYLNKTVLLRKIKRALEKADEVDIRLALKDGFFTYGYSVLDRFDGSDDEIDGFQVFVVCNCLRKDNCTNWDQYFSRRLKEFEDK